MKKAVAIVQRRLTGYRIPLFELMRENLATQDVLLRLLHGDPTPLELTKNDGGTLPWAEHLPTRYFGGGRICWQPFMRKVSDCDLVVLTQENKLVNNLVPLLNPWRRQKLAFWGHGRNMQSGKPDGLFEQVKRGTTLRVDWWFAYTEITADLVRNAGFDDAHITVLNNSVDVETLRQAISAARQRPSAELRAQFNLPVEGPVGIYIGSLFAEKKIDLLIAAAGEVHRQVPTFRLLIAGAGPDQIKVERAAAASPFITYLGSVQGARKAELLVTADMLLNPGMVGLGILDAFAAGIPILTTDCRLHSPEIAYLEQGRNGIMTTETEKDFSAAVHRLIAEPETARKLRQGSAGSCDKYLLASMAERFCYGIGRALEL